jgi:protein-S-isoprenylcysteine O-methyltransferase Ste14
MSQSTSLSRRTFEGLAQFLVALGIFVFLPAWSLRYWQGWIFWLEFSVLVTLITIYFLKKDPALIERRLKAGPGAEKEAKQKIIQASASFFFIALIIFPSIDHRSGWSHVPIYGVVAGDFLVAIGLIIVFFVFRENSFTSGVIEIGEAQTVISTGPYGLVRHPMYAGSLIMLLGVPLALGSAWGLLFCIPMIAVLVWRLSDEENFLCRNLPGYGEYRARVRHRLIPGVF